MKVDVSEIKTFKACARQWQLSSRNRFHLRPVVTPPQFAFGTLFHESLAQLYLGVSLDKVMTMVRREMQTGTDAALLAMVPGYYKNVLPGDLDRFTVLDIEHHFNIAPTTSQGEYVFPIVPATDAKTDEPVYDASGNRVMEPSLTICGSIDMIVLDKEQGKIYGFEHKTCKSFREESYLWMDEQPRVYTWALKQYIQQYNQQHGTEYTLGGVYLNEVKKLLRQFQYQRTLCTYSDEDLDNFMMAFFNDCKNCKHAVDTDSYAAPKPSYWSCTMCSFKSICSTYMYENLDKKKILDEFSEEFVVRTEDHLEEKTERSSTDAS